MFKTLTHLHSRYITPPPRILPLLVHLKRKFSTNAFNDEKPNLFANLDKPINKDEFEQLMEGVSSKGPIAVGLSGGSDSIALSLLLNDYCKERKRDFFSFIVDHKMREESTREAQTVSAWMTERGIKNEILEVRWGEDVFPAKPATKIMAICRLVRYHLLIDACEKYGVNILAVGHHLYDQAETFLIRLQRCSGIDGLCGMAKVIPNYYRSITLIRPFISSPKERMISTCKEYKQAYVTDPTNNDTSYTRNLVRFGLYKVMGLDSKIGYNILSGIINCMRHMKAAKTVVYSEVRSFLEKYTYYNPLYIFYFFDFEAFMALSPPVAYRVLSAVIQTLGGISKVNSPSHALRAKKLERLRESIIKIYHDQDSRPKGTVLQGTLFQSCSTKLHRKIPSKSQNLALKAKVLMVSSEVSKQCLELDPIQVDEHHLWNELFFIQIKLHPDEQLTEPLYIRALKASDQNKMKIITREYKSHFLIPQPTPIQWSLPVIVNAKDELIAAPHFEVNTLSHKMDIVISPRAKPQIWMDMVLELEKKKKKNKKR
eukprot:TRINITY_DN7397_c0_g2_i2.p1 TRINITY_DN7397_c0_g2~~TRINITY_DN7397_c0_g2_i2.p1  ORF type:complete len:563 (+),score=85.14 TRINITY_DN7397_c0_g2_i2:66-1691(+)